MNDKPKIIRVRRGIEGRTRYCACEDNGTPILGFNKLSDIRKHWKQEINYGYIVLIRELDKQPNMQILEDTIKCLEEIIKMYAK